MSRVFEAGGVWGGTDKGQGWVNLKEAKDGVEISHGYAFSVILTADAARRLGRQLLRFASRVSAK
jgi:hypothetical protein